MAVEVLVRRAVWGDLAGVVRLLAQLALTWTASQASTAVGKHHEQVWKAMLADKRRVVLVAEGGGGVVGVADLVVVIGLLDGVVPHGVLDNLVVDAPRRGLGVGRALIAGVRRAARDAGCCRVELLSSRELGRAYAFYRAVGFEAVAEGFRMNLTATVGRH
jgi:GNAT superfamily N-acetyltransferase